MFLFSWNCSEKLEVKMSNWVCPVTIYPWLFRIVMTRGKDVHVLLPIIPGCLGLLWQEVKVLHFLLTFIPGCLGLLWQEVKMVHVLLPFIPGCLGLLWRAAWRLRIIRWGGGEGDPSASINGNITLVKTIILIVYVLFIKDVFIL